MRFANISFCLFFILSGCASLFGNMKNEVTFRTAPEGAVIYIDGKEIGRTPLNHIVNPKMGVHKITVKMAGYKTETFTMKKSLMSSNSTFIFNWDTEVSKGKIFEYKTNSYFINLESNWASKSVDEALKFVQANYKELIIDITRNNGGKYSLNYSWILKTDHEYLLERLKENLPKILRSNDPVVFHHEAMKAI